MSMKRVRIAWLSVILLQSNVGLSIDSWSGMFSSVKSFPLFQASFWSNLGHGFGIPPSGYVYSFSVHNDSSEDVWVGQQRIVSLMGGCFPEAGGWSVSPPILPGTQWSQKNKEYYFEMFIKTTPKDYSNHMPYLQHSDVLYQHDLIQLQTQHSTHENYFRVYTGRDFLNGAYVHRQKAEYLGYIDMSGKKDPNALTFISNLSSLVIKNSTQKNYYIGFSSQPAVAVTDMKESLCSVFALVASDSFAKISAFSTLTSLRPGTVGVFDATTKTCLQTIHIAGQGFKDMPYTIEIYQDPGSSTVELGWQGLVSGHYDMPMNRVRDITPIWGYFWYQSSAQYKSGVDLPGTVWIVSVESQPEILATVTPGQVVQFLIKRPEIGTRKQIYFLYVDQSDSAKAQSFVQRFLSGAIGTSIVTSYNKQAGALISQAALQLQPQQANSKGTATASQSSESISPALMSQAVQGSLKINRGQIVDTVSGTTGYLLGGDVFLPLGTGSTPMYYSLVPSIQTAEMLPTSAVINMFAEQSVTTAPKGMPTPIMSTYALLPTITPGSTASAVATVVTPT